MIGTLCVWNRNGDFDGAVLSRKRRFKGEAVPFVMELAELPDAGSKKCRSSSVGQGERFSSACLYR